MALRSFLAGNICDLTFDFFTRHGERTVVSSPSVTVFTPERTKYVAGATNLTTVAGFVGQYRYDLSIIAAMTVGTWMAVATGVSQGATLFSGYTTFNVVDFVEEPLWLGIEDFREYIEEPDDAHTYDHLFSRLLTASMQLVEAFTRRWGHWRATETRQIRSADRMLLRAGYPVVSITGLTVTESYTPATPATLAETTVGTTVTFYYRLDKPTGTIIFTDSAGFETYYDDIFVTVDTVMGDGSVPEPMRLLALYWASKLLNLVTNEGLDNVRIADVNFAIRKGLMDDTAKDLLKNYRQIRW